MFEITENAGTFLKNHMEQQNLNSPVRVMKQQGCGGMGLVLALDEPQASDKTFDQNGITFLVDQGLLTECGGIQIDYSEPDASGCGCSGGGGLTIKSSTPLEGSGGGCGCSPGKCG